MVKLQKLNDSQFMITIPKKIANAKKWIKGTELDWRFNERGNLELEEVKT